MKEFNLTEAVETLKKFRAERDWEKYHTPKNLSMSIAIESAELMEHFQWRNDGEIQEYLNSDERLKVREEIADIASYLLLLCTDLGIDLNQAILEKVVKNAQKYPVDKARGRHDKYDRL